MKTKISIPFFLVSIFFISACSNYQYISENDVYNQKPTAINLEEDETDLTSFNAFRARERGDFSDTYQDSEEKENRLNDNRGFFPNTSVFFLGTFTNGPIAFHGMSPYNPFYDPFRSPYYYGTYPWGYYDPFYMPGFSSSPYWGFNNYGYPYYGGHYYGHHGWNPYYGGYGNYGYGNYYGGGYYGNGTSGNQNQGSNTVFYGKRNSLTSSSGRSSAYPSTLKSASSYGNNTFIANKNLKETKPVIAVKEAGSSDYIKGMRSQNNAGVERTNVGIERTNERLNHSVSSSERHQGSRINRDNNSSGYTGSSYTPSRAVQNTRPQSPQTGTIQNNRQINRNNYTPSNSRFPSSPRIETSPVRSGYSNEHRPSRDTYSAPSSRPSSGDFNRRGSGGTRR